MDDLRNISILLLIFSGALMLYAAVLAKAGDPKLIPRHYSVKMKNEKAYARQFAKVIALVAAAPLLSGLVGLITGNGVWLVRVLLGGIVLAIAIGVDIVKKVL